jgi:hypothetical protein
MRKKFLQLYESTLNRYTNGGFLTSDLVTFKPGWEKHPHFQGQDQLLKGIKQLVDSGYNIRVTNVKPSHPVASGNGNTDYHGTKFAIDVAPEIAPGKFGDSLTVCPDILIVHDTVPNLPPISDNAKRHDKVIIKPQEVDDEETSDEVPFYGPGRTRKTDKGDGKDSKSVSSLNNSNTKIPAVPAEGHKDPANYTANYLPKKR